MPSRVRVVTDSSSDILPSHAHAIGVIVVPNRVVLDGAVLRDGVDITSAQFYARLPRAARPPYTQPAPPEELYAAYLAAFQQGATDVVSIHISSRLSKVCRHAMAARDALAPAPIDVIDSQISGIGMWPAVIRAAQLASVGASRFEIHEVVLSLLTRTRLYFMVETLEYLRRGGRIGRARELIGTLADAHPILTIARGEVAPVETARPRSRALRRLRELALDQGEIESLIICGTSIEVIAQMEALLADRYGGTISKTWLGPTQGANTGPAIAIAVVAR
jgi:DegV family protein with EDD domain